MWHNVCLLVGSMAPRRLAESSRQTSAFEANFRITSYIRVIHHVIGWTAIILPHAGLEVLVWPSTLVVLLVLIDAAPVKLGVLVGIFAGLVSKFMPVKICNTVPRGALTKRPGQALASSKMGRVILGVITHRFSITVALSLALLVVGAENFGVATLARHTMGMVMDALEITLRTKFLGIVVDSRGVEGPLRSDSYVWHLVGFKSNVVGERSPSLLSNGQLVPLVLHELLVELLRASVADITRWLPELFLGPRWIPAPDIPVVARQSRVRIAGRTRLHSRNTWQVGP